MNNKNFHEKVILKAIKDKAFREELIKNPKKVIEKELKESLPKELSIKIVEQQNNEWVIVLPKTENKKEISDEDLSNVKGAHGTGTCVTVPVWFCPK